MTEGHAEVKTGLGHVHLLRLFGHSKWKKFQNRHMKIMRYLKCVYWTNLCFWSHVKIQHVCNFGDVVKILDLRLNVGHGALVAIAHLVIGRRGQHQLGHFSHASCTPGCSLTAYAWAQMHGSQMAMEEMTISQVHTNVQPEWWLWEGQSLTLGLLEGPLLHAPRLRLPSG